MAPRYRKKDPTPQQTPSFQRLLEKHHSGYTSKKEITRRVKAGMDGGSSPEEERAFQLLESIAKSYGWV